MIAPLGPARYLGSQLFYLSTQPAFIFTSLRDHFQECIKASLGHWQTQTEKAGPQPRLSCPLK